jgi:hypothetical protein
VTDYTSEELNSINECGIGNAAYIYLHCPFEIYRNFSKKLLDDRCLHLA